MSAYVLGSQIYQVGISGESTCAACGYLFSLHSTRSTQTFYHSWPFQSNLLTADVLNNASLGLSLQLSSERQVSAVGLKSLELGSE